MRYAMWEDVKARFRLADTVVPNVPDRELLLDDKTSIFRAFTANVRRAALTPKGDGSYEATAKEVVADLVAGELQKRHTPNQQLREMDFGFISGAYTTRECDAYAKIKAIKDGDLVFEEDPALREVTLPEALAASANTSNGKVIALLPTGYKAHVPGVFVVKCTTAGRVDAGSARFTVYFQNDASEPLATGLEPLITPQHIRNEFYLVFRDGTLSGNSFVLNDSWTVTCYPPESAARSRGPREIGLFLS